MNSALLYRPGNHKLTWIAFECAITIYLTAIAIAGNKATPVLIPSFDEDGPPVFGTFDPPPQPEEAETPDQLIPPPNEDAFPTETAAPPPIRPHKKTPINPIRSNNIGTGQAPHAGSVKSLTLYAPRPSYPYEARRSGTTGSGIAELTVNSATGNVIAARMFQSTGSSILDAATLSAFRQWRFKPGVASSITVPITYTLSGISY